ncbi:toll/interleukin-1 receptor domain-containing protein [Actinomadura graeca]|uniref:Toll/interleukin-1 receptor domain-containing protein n=1 Tax=Actinomadura graeca TaxID=2750812 RepID=A0ABX8QUF3_9ACTN|nr:toll/interleukin-1 receptor domain-containing protein [Actinomadura graeca]QXJ22365.1 toll/interleukin-1 receptor domain-containing protein [Actinomadura graeca]
MAEVYLAYGRADAAWVRGLWRRLDRHGIDAFFDELIPPGKGIVHTLEQAILDTTAAVVVFGPGLAGDGWALDEYAALLRSCTEKGLPFIPVTFGGAPVPPFARNRVRMDFGDAAGPDLDRRAAELAGILRDEATGYEVPEGTVLSEPSRPLPEPRRRSVVVCYAPADAEYGRRLVERVHGAGLPVWSVRSLRPGDRHVWTIRQQLRHATAIVVVMSPAADESEDVTRMILEGEWHGREFFPVWLAGDRHYLLANLWWADARTGGPLADGALAQLVELHEAVLSGRPAPQGEAPPEPSRSAPALPSVSPVPAVSSVSSAASVHVPASLGLKRLRAALAEREFEHADLLTTALLLEAAGRAGTGFIGWGDAAGLPCGLLSKVDRLWAAATDGRQGFRAQTTVAPAGGRSHLDFLVLAGKLGWHHPDSGAMPAYPEFAARALGRPRFFPTLRNPRGEQRANWYDLWTETVLTVHARLQKCGVRP